MPLFETLKYELLSRDGHIEIRKYNDFLLAKTKTDPDYYQNSGFNNVFQYISGYNEDKQRISMTTPVVTQIEEGKLSTGFYVPSKYDESNVPKPKSSNVTIENIQEGIFITIRFSGNWKQERFEKYDKILQDYIKENNLKILSHRYILRYNPPMTPAFLRRNEIMYRINK